jgi:hypothetical protein
MQTPNIEHRTSNAELKTVRDLWRILLNPVVVSVFRSTGILPVESISFRKASLKAASVQKETGLVLFSILDQRARCPLAPQAETPVLLARRRELALGETATRIEVEQDKSNTEERAQDRLKRAKAEPGQIKTS